MALTFARPDETRAHLLRAAGAAVRRGRRAALVAAAFGPGRAHAHLRRPRLARLRDRHLRRDVGRRRGARRDRALPRRPAARARTSTTPSSSRWSPDESATLFEHCARGLDQCLELTGAHGLPLMGTGDWNDGMNRVGEGGKGESVWLGWLLLRTIDAVRAAGRSRAIARRAPRRWRAHADVGARGARARGLGRRLVSARDLRRRHAGSARQQSDECRIDSIAQSWAVLSGAADPARAAAAMASLEEHLIRRDDGLALLFTPPFDQTPLDPGYIKGYPPGLRENGGQYTHAAMWAILAFAKLGRRRQGRASCSRCSTRSTTRRTPQEVDRYKVEPYVVAADVYSVAPHAGRGGWTWYTGSAGWMYRAGIEGILGIRREGAVLVVEPCIPEAWPGFAATVEVSDTRYDIRVEASGRRRPRGRPRDARWRARALRRRLRAGAARGWPAHAGDLSLRLRRRRGAIFAGGRSRGGGWRRRSCDCAGAARRFPRDGSPARAGSGLAVRGTARTGGAYPFEATAVPWPTDTHADDPSRGAARNRCRPHPPPRELSTCDEAPGDFRSCR